MLSRSACKATSSTAASVMPVATAPSRLANRASSREIEASGRGLSG